MNGYLALFVRSLRANFAYRQAILPAMLSAALVYAVPFLVWSHVYGANPRARAVPSKELFPYLLLAACLNFALAMNVEFRVGQRIRTGAIATDLLKPVDFQLAQASQALSDGLFNLCLCVPLFGVAYAFLGKAVLPAGPFALLAFLLSALFGFAIMFSLSFIFVQAAFFTNSGYGIIAARNALQATFAGLAAPLALFPDWLRRVSECLPFRHTIHSPVALYLGWSRGSAAGLLLVEQAAWAVLLFVLGRSVHQFAIRRLEVQGG